MIRDGAEYREQGGDFFDRQDPRKTAKRLAKRLERLGFAVVPKTTPASLAAWPPSGGRRVHPFQWNRLEAVLNARIGVYSAFTPAILSHFRNIRKLHPAQNIRVNLSMVSKKRDSANWANRE